MARSHRATYLLYRSDAVILGSFFLEKGRRLTFVKRKWKIENNDREEVQFQTLQKAPGRRAYEERKDFPTRIEKGIQLAAVR